MIAKEQLEQLGWTVCEVCEYNTSPGVIYAEMQWGGGKAGLEVKEKEMTLGRRFLDKEPEFWVFDLITNDHYLELSNIMDVVGLSKPVAQK
jgi:hypothetical protein